MTPPDRTVRSGSAWQPKRALLVGSAGGHLAQLLELRAWWEDRERLWITQDSPATRSQLRGERLIPGHFPTTRSARNLLRNAALAARVIATTSPDIVVSTGAGIAFPFVVLARVMGIPTVFIEVFDRVQSRTLTGILCRPWTNLFVVQWPQQQMRYRRSQLIGALWAAEGTHQMKAARPDGPPLLLVTVGTDHHPFDRLFTWIDRYVTQLSSEIDIRLVCQHGTAPPPTTGEGSAWFEHEELQRLLGEASVVVVHGGPYSIIESMRQGLKPIVVPRERRFGEAVDDHQVAFCSLLSEDGDVICVREEDQLRRALDSALADPEALRPRVGSCDADTATSVERFRALVRDLGPPRRERRSAQHE